jgi:hypothetical protein
MKNLEIIKKEIDEKIQNTIEALALESIANMIRKFRLYAINHEIELCFSIIPIRPEDIITYEDHFDKNCKAHLYHKNTVIDVKEELKELCFFVQHFNKKDLRIMFFGQQRYTEHLFLNIVRQSLIVADVGFDKNMENVHQKIEELSAIEEKKQLEDSLKQDSVKNSPIKI